MSLHTYDRKDLIEWQKELSHTSTESSPHDLFVFLRLCVSLASSLPLFVSHVVTCSPSLSLYFSTCVCVIHMYAWHMWLYVFNVHSKHSHMHKNAKNLNQCSSSSLLPSRCVNVCGNTGSICECINIFCVGASQCVCGHPKLCFTSDATLFVGVIDAQALE